MNLNQNFGYPQAESETYLLMEPIKSPHKHLNVAFNYTGVVSAIMKHRGIISLLDQGLVSATNFATGMIIGRACSKDEFGFYMLGLTILIVAIDVQSALITIPYMTYSPKMDSSARTFYNGSSLLHLTALSLILSIILLFTGLFLTLYKGFQELGTIFQTLAFFGIFIMFRDYVRRILFAQLKMHKALLFDAAVSALQLIGLLILVGFGLLSAAKTYIVIGTVSGCAVLVWLLISRHEIVISLAQAMADAYRSWNFGKWVLTSGLVWTFSMGLYPWFIAAFHGTASTGVWAACMGIMAIGNPILVGMQNYLGPRIVKVYAESGPYSLRKYVYSVSLKFAGILSPVLLMLIFFGGSLVSLVYGEKYAGNGAIVALLGINLTLSAISFSFSRAYFAIERADLDFKTNLSALLVLFSAGIWLVRAIGPFGAAMGLVAANVVSLSIRCIIFTKLVKNSTLTKQHYWTN